VFLPSDDILQTADLSREKGTLELKYQHKDHLDYMWSCSQGLKSVCELVVS
jgi:hypothetical protein